MTLHTKRPYSKPLITVTTVKFEDSICAASADITNLQNTENGAIQAQNVNADFNPKFDGTGTNFGWDVPVTTTPGGKE